MTMQINGTTTIRTNTTPDLNPQFVKFTIKLTGHELSKSQLLSLSNLTHKDHINVNNNANDDSQNDHSDDNLNDDLDDITLGIKICHNIIKTSHGQLVLTKTSLTETEIECLVPCCMD